MGHKVMQRSGGSINEESAPLGLAQKKTWEKDADGEYENTKHKDNAALLQQQKDMLNAQDDALDKIGGVVDVIRFENQNFKEEVNLQNRMLDKVNNQIDETSSQMIKLEGKVGALLAKGSICKLWVIIIIELVILVILISLL